MQRTLFALVLLLAACQRQEPTSSAAAVTVTGADGRSVAITSTERIVSIGGNVTETLWALGAGARIVGADTSSLYPDAAAALPKVGYQRMVSAEGIAALSPTLVVGTEDAGPPTVLEQLREAGIPVLIVSAAPNLDGARARIDTLSAAIGAQEKGRVLRTGLDEALARRPHVARPVRVLAIYARGGGTLNVAGTGTAAHEMVTLVGAVNVMTAFEGYRPLTAEAVVAASPEVILVTTRGLESAGGVDGLLAAPGLSETPAGRGRRVVALDDLLLLGFGPRTGDAVAALQKGLERSLAP